METSRPYVNLGIITLQYSFDKTDGVTGKLALPIPLAAKIIFCAVPIISLYMWYLSCLSVDNNTPRCTCDVTTFRSWFPNLTGTPGMQYLPHIITTDYSVLNSYCYFTLCAWAMVINLLSPNLRIAMAMQSSAKAGHVESRSIKYAPYWLVLSSWSRSLT